MDTDVVVVLIGVFHKLLLSQPKADIWVAFGVRKNYRHYSINALSTSLGTKRSKALPMLHTISGCDTTSAFWGKGKKSFWQAWMAFEEVTDTFVYLASHPFEPLDSNCENFRKIERLIVLVYDKTSTSVSINQTRRELFCLKNITMERMPPMQKALLQHEEGCLPSFYLDYKYRSTADDSFPKRLWLETSRQCVEPTLANCFRAF